MQEENMSTQDLVSKEALPLNPWKEHQQSEVTTLRIDKNKKGKMNPETQITRKKERKLSKKKTKLEKLREILEKNLQETDLQNMNFTRITEPCRLGLHHGEAI
jgi:hypothetical protein